MESSTLYDYSKDEFDLGINMNDTAQMLMKTLFCNQKLIHSMIFNESFSEDYDRVIREYLEKDGERHLLREGVDPALASYLYSALEYIAFQYCRQHDLDFTKDETIISKLSDMFFSEFTERMQRGK
ncbi:MAG: hypothetical protein HFE76_00675 [Firmicutes bacterium]|nr:hypothetical protein [Bacillota bacterium]